MKKSDLLASIILGLIVGLFLYAVLKTIGPDLPLLVEAGRSLWLLFALLIAVPVLILIWVYVASHLGVRYPALFQFGKFIPIGVSNTAIDFGVLNLLILITGATKGYMYSVFIALAFLVAVTNSYLWNKFWTFDSRGRKDIHKEFAKFLMVAGVGLAIKVATATYVVNMIEPMWGLSDIVWANIGSLVSLVVMVVWDFFGYKYLVFN